MTPVVLAGGFSTRLPFKLFITQTNMEPVIMSSLRMACALFPETQIRILTNAANAPMIFKIVKHYFKGQWASARQTPVAHIIQDEHLGVVGAIDLVRAEDDVCVFCGDNIYGGATEEACSKLLKRFSEGKQAAAFGYGDDLCDNHRLDGFDYSENKWLPRDRSPVFHLTSPWLLPQGTLPSGDGDTQIITLLNHLNAYPVCVHDTEWSDLGTVETVSKYYQGG